MLHLLVASFRALPLDLMVPVSRRGFVWLFSWIFFPPFCFFSVLFLWVSQSKRAISPALSVWTPSHMRTVRNLPAASARKSLGRFITLILTWCGHDGWIVYISFRVRFSNDHWVRKRGTLQKMSSVAAADSVLCSCLFNTWENFVIEMPRVQFWLDSGLLLSQIQNESVWKNLI